ncbi:LysR family transcriptional regulator [bacterium AH-315-K03]|nr:LysR family transcriptional regulator [bacterium AH-315-K03]
MKFNFKQLEVFRAIMIAKTVSGAAELLFLSQPAVSRALKTTEMKLGIQLFERNKGRLIPTPEGEELFKELEPIYARIEGLEWTIDRLTQNENRLLRIGCTPSLARHILPRLITETRKKSPDITLRIDVLSNEELADYITVQKGDFAVSLYDPNHPLISAEPSISSDVVCVVPKEHTLAKLECVALEDLAAYDWVLYHPDCALGRMSTQLFDGANIQPKTSVLVRYNDDACAMVEYGAGLSLVSEFVLMGNSYPKLQAVRLTKTCSFQIHTLRHNGVPMSHNARIFYQHFREAMGRLS